MNRVRVLMVATGEWVSTARLAMALDELGCRVELVGSAGHPAHATGVLAGTYRYDPLRPLGSVRRALKAADADAVVPADELALMHLKDLVDGEGVFAPGERAQETELRRLVRRSVGPQRVLGVAESRMALLRLAESEGIAAPGTAEVQNEADVRAAVERFGLPVVLKADATSGGRGVKVAKDLEEALRGWKRLGRPPNLASVLKRGFTAGEWTHVRSWAKRTTRGVTMQKFVAGREATGMAMCHEGELVSGVCLEVVESWCARGPSSVVRVMENPVMEEAMRRVAKRLGVSGFCGFDFILEPESGKPLLIEMNPRPTQLVHLPLGPGRDLVAAYMREVLGQGKVEDRASVGEGLIAVFPLELQRDPAGACLGEAFHDVPWESPALIGRALKTVPALISEDARWRGGRR